ncbi:hypothetical protein [Chroococcidiopsis sp. TS-821]|nr:hypothetical protein [Chroococcidiopsis sp. TS-821]
MSSVELVVAQKRGDSPYIKSAFCQYVVQRPTNYHAQIHES